MDRPARTFKAVDVGYDFACALTAAGDIICWGYDGDRRATPPDGQFISVAVGELHTCGILSHGEISCWGNRQGRSIPEGRFKQISAGFNTTCGVIETKLLESQIICSEGSGGLAQPAQQPPPGYFDSVSVSGNSACAIRRSGTIACWSIDMDLFDFATTCLKTTLAYNRRPKCSDRSVTLVGMGVASVSMA